MRKFMTICAVAGMIMAVSDMVLADLVPPAAPSTVPGKEYSDAPSDINAAGAADNHQNIAWDGLGGVADTFDYTTGLGLVDPGLQNTWVDALAHVTDNLYDPVSHADAVTMLASFAGIGDIHYTAAAHHGIPGVHGTLPVNGIWASAGVVGTSDINGVTPPTDVDGLEVWGPDGAGGDNADKYSLSTDPAIGVGPFAGTRVSVWNYMGGGAAADTIYLTAAAIATAIGRQDLADSIDLDAMMIFDGGGSPNTFTAVGDSIMFSIAPIDVFDGGEIWVWDWTGAGGGLAAFLVHGGETWNTIHSVTTHFGLGVDHENINALEAVPEPATLALLLLGGGLVLMNRRKSGTSPLMQ